MKLLLFLATVAAIALFYWISSTSIDIPAKWSLALKIEYRWYIFQDKLGLPMNTADRRHFQLMIDEALDVQGAKSSMSRQGPWLGHIYADRSNLAEAIAIGRFDTLDLCRAAAQVRLSGIGALTTGDYECGKNCAPTRTDQEIWRCSETSR